MRNTILGVCATLAFTLASSGANAQGSVFSAETSIPGNSTHGVMVAIAGAIQSAGLGNVQIQDGQTLTKSMLNVATGRTDIATMPGAAYTLLQRGSGPYKELGDEKGGALAAQVVALAGFQPTNFVPIAFNDSGIQSWQDFKGKRVFVGPPAGVFSVNATRLISAVTGYKAGEDYEPVKVTWAAAVDDMIGRKFDVMIMSASDPSPAVQQMAASGDITMFGIPASIAEKNNWSDSAGIVGASPSTHGTQSYEKGVTYKHVSQDQDIVTISANMFIGVNKSMDEDVAYKIVKSMLANIEEIEVSAAFMPSTGLRKGIVGLVDTQGIKLHPGAVRAYEESGITVPDSLK